MIKIKLFIVLFLGSILFKASDVSADDVKKSNKMENVAEKGNDLIGVLSKFVKIVTGPRGDYEEYRKFLKKAMSALRSALNKTEYDFGTLLEKRNDFTEKEFNYRVKKYLKKYLNDFKEYNDLTKKLIKDTYFYLVESEAMICNPSYYIGTEDKNLIDSVMNSVKELRDSLKEFWNVLYREPNN